MLCHVLCCVVFLFVCGFVVYSVVAVVRVFVSVFVLYLLVFPVISCVFCRFVSLRVLVVCVSCRCRIRVIRLPVVSRLYFLLCFGLYFHVSCESCDLSIDVFCI